MTRYTRVEPHKWCSEWNTLRNLMREAVRYEVRRPILVESPNFVTDTGLARDRRHIVMDVYECDEVEMWREDGD